MPCQDCSGHYTGEAWALTLEYSPWLSLILKAANFLLSPKQGVLRQLSLSSQFIYFPNSCLTSKDDLEGQGSKALNTYPCLASRLLGL